MRTADVRHADGWAGRLLTLCGRAPVWLLSCACLLTFYVTDAHFAPSERVLVTTLVGMLSLLILPLVAALADGGQRTLWLRLNLAVFWCLFALSVNLLPPTAAGAHYRRFRSLHTGMSVADAAARLPGSDVESLPADFSGVVSVLDADRLDVTARRFLLVFQEGRVADRRFGSDEDFRYRFRAIDYGMRDPEVRALLTAEVVPLAFPTVQREQDGHEASSWTSPGWKWYPRSGIGPDGVRVQYDASGVVYKQYVRTR